MTETTPEPVYTVQLRKPTFAKIPALLVTLIVSIPFFVITFIGYLVAKGGTNTAWLAYREVDYSDDKYDALYEKWQAASSLEGVWAMLYELAVPLLAVSLLGLIIASVVARRSA